VVIRDRVEPAASPAMSAMLQTLLAMWRQRSVCGTKILAQTELREQLTAGHVTDLPPPLPLRSHRAN